VLAGVGTLDIGLVAAVLYAGGSSVTIVAIGWEDATVWSYLMVSPSGRWRAGISDITLMSKGSPFFAAVVRQQVFLRVYVVLSPGLFLLWLEYFGCDINALFFLIP
jgi:hypothetical protein